MLLPASPSKQSPPPPNQPLISPTFFQPCYLYPLFLIGFYLCFIVIWLSCPSCNFPTQSPKRKTFSLHFQLLLLVFRTSLLKTEHFSSTSIRPLFLPLSSVKPLDFLIHKLVCNIFIFFTLWFIIWFNFPNFSLWFFYFVEYTWHHSVMNICIWKLQIRYIWSYHCFLAL